MFGAAQGLICCFSDRGENVSMVHFKEVAIVFISIFSLYRVDKSRKRIEKCSIVVDSGRLWSDSGRIVGGWVRYPTTGDHYPTTDDHNLTTIRPLATTISRLYESIKGPCICHITFITTLNLLTLNAKALMVF